MEIIYYENSETGAFLGGFGNGAMPRPADNPVEIPAPVELLKGQWRETASLTKQEFCIGLFTLGILSMEEAEGAVKGDWPATFLPALSSMTDQEAGVARITWAGAQSIGRNHALIQLLQQYSQTAGTVPTLTDELVDQLFGWSSAE